LRVVLIAALCLAVGPFSVAPRPAEAGLGTWTATNGPFGGFIRALAIDPITPSTVYAGTSRQGVYRSTDGGTHWSAINVGFPTVSGLPSIAVLAIAIDPKTPSTLYLGTDGSGVFRSENGGESWQPIKSGLADAIVRSLAVDPKTPATVYAGTDKGVFKSTNGGASWTAVNTGMGSLRVNALAIDPRRRRRSSPVPRAASTRPLTVADPGADSAPG
jgi:photosystem II stability/assembly factor-like uncharacterized protein